MKRGRMNCIMVPGGILLLLVLFCGTVKSNPTQPADQGSGGDAVPGTCILSGTVINFDTNEPIPYFCLLYTKGGGGGILEFLETDEKGHFRTTAPRGSERSLKLHQSSRGTYIIDWDQQMQILPRPFRGIVRDDMTDFIFKVKLWPVTTLTGKVLDESSQPAGNASVYFHHNVPEVKTDATGTFRLQTAPTDRDFDLFAILEDKNKAGFVHLKAGSTTATINLEPTESYNGRVIDTEGTPVGPFEFIVGLRLNGSNNDCLQQRLQADTDGTFTIDYLYPKMSYYFWWFPDEQVNRTLGEYGSKTIDLTKQNPNDDIEIVVEQYLNAVTGRILDTKGAPVKEAKVMVHTRHGIQAQYRRHKAVLSDKNGRFSLQNLTDGEVLFHIYKKGYKMKYIWTPTDSTDMEVTLRPSSEMGICEVHVVDDDYKPVPNAPVHLDICVSDTGRLLESHNATTNAEGRAEFKIKDFGDKVRARGIISCDMQWYDLAYNSVSDNCDSQVKLALHKTGEHWSGKIVDPQNNPVVGAKLYLTSTSQRIRTTQRKTAQTLGQSFFSDPSELTLLTRTDEKGEFVLDRFNKKDFVRIAVKAPGFKSWEIDFDPEDNTAMILNPFNFSEIKDFVFKLTPGVTIVKGLFVDGSSGKPLSNATIELRAENNRRDIFTGKDGTFLIEDLDPGEYVPVLKTFGGASDKNYVCVPDVLIAEADKTMQVTLKAQEGIPLKGRLIESGTQQRPSAERVYLDARLKSGQTISTGFVEKDGSWELLLLPGDYDLYYSIFYENISRFIDSEEPFSITVEQKQYENLVLEISNQGTLLLQPPPLVGISLPDLKDLRVNLSPADVNDKSILVCFFDMDQRPSRNCILQLSKRAQELRAKDIITAIIQAADVEKTKLDEWVKENNITFPVGMIQADEEKTRFKWGVKSLPWLILTEIKHVVIAEGFNINELDEKITKLLTTNNLTTKKSPDWHEEVISTLEYIARGYEANAAGIDRLRIRGRIFHAQYAKEGKTISESQTYAPQWYNFEHIWKDGKRRYQQDKLASPKKQFYVLDNNERLLTFTNSVGIHPLTEEESTWYGLIGLYGDFFRLYGVHGCENVGLAMRYIIKDINEGWYDDIPEHGSIRVEVTEEGLFVIHFETAGIGKRRCIIDSHKGFNLISSEEIFHNDRFWYEDYLRYEYMQLPNGHYMLKSAQRTGFEDNVVFEYRLETKEIQTDFEAPDEWFEEESLNIPLDASRTDHSYSPPLKYRKGGTPDKD